MKTFEFFWNYFKVYKISFVVVIAMIIIATVAQALFPVFAGQTVTELANLVIAYQNHIDKTRHHEHNQNIGKID